MPQSNPIKRIGFIGNHLPRQCGIATFTTDLCGAIAAEFSDTTCIALPVNDIAEGYAPPAGELPVELARDGSLYVETIEAFEAPPVGCGERV